MKIKTHDLYEETTCPGVLSRCSFSKDGPVPAKPWRIHTCPGEALAKTESNSEGMAAVQISAGFYGGKTLLESWENETVNGWRAAEVRRMLLLKKTSWKVKRQFRFVYDHLRWKFVRSKFVRSNLIVHWFLIFLYMQLYRIILLLIILCLSRSRSPNFYLLWVARRRQRQ